MSVDCLSRERKSKVRHAERKMFTAYIGTFEIFTSRLWARINELFIDVAASIGRAYGILRPVLTTL